MSGVPIANSKSGEVVDECLTGADVSIDGTDSHPVRPDKTLHNDDEEQIKIKPIVIG